MELDVPVQDQAPPTIDELDSELRAIVGRLHPALPLDGLTDDTLFKPFGLSSIEVLCLVFEVEEKYGIDIVKPGLDEFERFGEMKRLVHRLIVARGREA